MGVFEGCEGWGREATCAGARDAVENAGVDVWTAHL